MKKKQVLKLSIVLLAGLLLGGCAGEESVHTDISTVETSFETETEEGEELPSEEETEKETVLPDGVYAAEFDTDNSMFRVNEAYDGKGTLTVENGEMIIHVSLASKNIVNLYTGLAEDAQKEGAELLYPTVDTVTYSDGWIDEVYGFDIPVPVLDEEFDVALIGTKGKWYDHKVIVSNPEPLQDETVQAFNTQELEDGNYTVELTLEGGSGKAEVLSPATVVVVEGTMTATIQWSSPNYDYMIVDGEKYLPVNTEGNSVFEIPVKIFDEPIDVIGDTVAMSTPHEIEYTLTFHSDTMKTVE
ncbi:MAG: iron transporter [Lachnospiraceae bacterium]|nr:iron transporter [Lachnospiraceae bacterium]